MGYAGKVHEQQRARELRAQSWTLAEIASELGVSRSSVSLWVRDVPFTPRPRSPSMVRRPSRLQLRKRAEIARCDAEAVATIGPLDDRTLLVAGAALYWGEGFKRDGMVGLANTDPAVLLFFVTWLRRCFGVDEHRLRVRLYLHEGLDLETATAYWSELLRIPVPQFGTPYRAAANATRRSTKHPYGCPAVRCSDSLLHRRVMGLVRALSCLPAFPG
jgi:transcriptional regulator with XRE-family HTH domain